MATESTTDATPRPRRSLDRRTVAISACIALIAALAAALVATSVLSDDDDGSAEGRLSLDRNDVNVEQMLATPLTTIEGEPTSLGELLGDKPALVNLWQQSCVPCVEEMPLLEEAAQANSQIDVIGVDTQDRLDKALVMAEQTGITYPWVQDPDGLFFFETKATGMPATLLLTAEGEVLSVRNGVFKDLAQVQDFIDDGLRGT